MDRDVEQRRDRQRLVTLVGVSAVLHVFAFWALSKLEPAELHRNKPVQMELSWVDAQPEPAPVQVTPEPVAPVTPQQQQQVTKTKKVQPSPQASPPQGEGGTSGVAISESGVGTNGDFPIAERPSLLPSDNFAKSLGTGGVEETPRGSTVRNGPGEAPDQRSLNEYTGEVLTRKLNSDLAQQVGLAGVEVGNVPPHFKRYEQAMRSMLPGAKIDRTPLTGKEVVGEIAGVLFNNGPSAEASKKVADTPLGRSITNNTVMSPTVDDQRFRESALQLLAQTENVKERITRARLRTVLEVTTDARGVLAEVNIVERSGDPKFDESVLHFSRKVARTIPDSDDKLLGTSVWRTRWQFTWEPPEVRVRLLNAWRIGTDPSLQ